MTDCMFVIVGDDTDDNFRLSKILRKIYGRQNVTRFFELESLEPFLASRPDVPIVVCLDLLGFDSMESEETIGRVRDAFPKVVFNLYLDHDEYKRQAHGFSADWRLRLEHYYRTYKEPEDVEFEPIVRGSIAPSEQEALYNVSGVEPIRLTPGFSKGLVEPAGQSDDLMDEPTTFISYSRKDWVGFVSGLVSALTEQSQKVWIDQDFIEGGDDWMDAIGKALQVCDTLLLVLSPNAISSRYVRMEYRYFFHQEKPIIPLLYQRVEQLPFELATLHYIDFTQGDATQARSSLLSILSQQRNP